MLELLFPFFGYDCLDTVDKTKIRVEHTPPVVAFGFPNLDSECLVGTCRKSDVPIALLREVCPLQSCLHRIGISFPPDRLLGHLLNPG